MLCSSWVFFFQLGVGWKFLRKKPWKGCLLPEPYLNVGSVLVEALSSDFTVSLPWESSATHPLPTQCTQWTYLNISLPSQSYLPLPTIKLYSPIRNSPFPLFRSTSFSVVCLFFFFFCYSTRMKDFKDVISILKIYRIYLM
jgi:hypothetical protein